MPSTTIPLALPSPINSNPRRKASPRDASWSGRFDEAPDQLLLQFGASFKFDRRLFEDDVRGSLAWAEALSAAGVLNAADNRAIRAGLEEILERGRTDPAFFDAEKAAADEDVHSFVERELVQRVGEAGRRLHTGRSRNEQVALDLRLYLKRRIPIAQQAIAALITTLADQAERSGSALMPSYTHLRRAQPVLVPISSSLTRPRSVAITSVSIRFSTSSTNYRSIGRNRRHQLRHRRSRARADPGLLLSWPTASTRPVIATSWLRFCFTAALAMVHVSRLAEDLILFTSEEFGFLSSRIPPQPVAA